MRRDTLLVSVIVILAIGCGGLYPEGAEVTGDDEELALEEVDENPQVQWGQGVHAVSDLGAEPARLNSHEQAIFGNLFGDLLIGLGGQLIGNLLNGGGSKGQTYTQPPQLKVNGNGCGSHQECASGFCNGGICAWPPAGQSVAGRCTDSAQCPSGASCDIQLGVCVLASAQGAGRIGACTLDTQCPAGTECDTYRGVCVDWQRASYNNYAAPNPSTNQFPGGYASSGENPVLISEDLSPAGTLCQSGDQCQSGVCMPDTNDSSTVPAYVCQAATMVSFSNGVGGCALDGKSQDPRTLVLLLCALWLLRRRRLAAICNLLVSLGNAVMRGGEPIK